MTAYYTRMAAAIAGETLDFVVATQAMSAASEPRNKQSRSKLRRRSANVLEVELDNALYQHLTWVGIGSVAGTLMIWRLGLLAQGIGIFLIALVMLRAYKFVRALLRPAGTFRIDKKKVVLPVGICSGHEQTFDLSEIRHAYCLRRASGWTRGGPHLVVEAGDQAYVYPREWFLSDSDQYHIAETIRQRTAQAQTESHRTS